MPQNPGGADPTLSSPRRKVLPGSLDPNPFPAIQSGGGGCLPPPPVVSVGHENIPLKEYRGERKPLRDMEEQDVGYLLSLSTIQEAKDAIFCSRAGCEAVPHKASMKESRCWAPFPVPATWVSRGPVFSLQVANRAGMMDVLQEAL